MQGPDSKPQAPRLYSELAHLWPLLSPPGDYLAEAAVLRTILDQFAIKGNERLRLLEFGAGGGHTLHHLGDQYAITAVDLSEQMITNCRRLNPGIRCVVGDMRALQLDQVFDAVFVHDAIDYMTSEHDLRLALTNAARHLRAGGLVVIAPTYVADDFEDGETSGDTVAGDDCDVTYISYVHDPDPTDSSFEMVLVYLVRVHATRAVRVIEDRHTCGLFARAQWLELLAASGFESWTWDAPEDVDGFDAPTWPVFLGRKR